MGQIALSEGHEEPYALDALDVQCQGFKLLVVQKVHILFAHLVKVVNSLYLHRLGLDPLAVLNVRAFSGDLTNVYLRIEISRKRIAVVAAVAVENVDIVYLVKVVLLSVCTENACNTGVKARTEQRCYACLFKALSVSPLPGILKLSGILRLVVCGINVVHLAFKAGVHYVQILIRQCNIYADVGLVLFHKLDKLGNVVSVHLCSSYLSLCLSFKLSFELVAL